jgi:hypothetical protein
MGGGAIIKAPTEGIIEKRIIERRIIRRDREIESGIYRARDTKESDNRGWKKMTGKI